MALEELLALADPEGSGSLVRTRPSTSTLGRAAEGHRAGRGQAGLGVCPSQGRVRDESGMGRLAKVAVPLCRALTNGSGHPRRDRSQERPDSPPPGADGSMKIPSP